MAGRKPLISEILKLLNAKCMKCGSMKDLQVNHKIPLSQVMNLGIKLYCIINVGSVIRYE